MTLWNRIMVEKIPNKALNKRTLGVTHIWYSATATRPPPTTHKEHHDNTAPRLLYHQAFKPCYEQTLENMNAYMESTALRVMNLEAKMKGDPRTYALIFRTLKQPLIS